MVPWSTLVLVATRNYLILFARHDAAAIPARVLRLSYVQPVVPHSRRWDTSRNL